MSVRAEVVVGRCVVTVVRHGGWSWGAEPGRHAERLVEMLPGLVAGQFAGLAAGGQDVEITEPVVVRVRVRLADLTAAGTAAPRLSSGDVSISVPSGALRPVPPTGSGDDYASFPSPAGAGTDSSDPGRHMPGTGTDSSDPGRHMPGAGTDSSDPGRHMPGAGTDSSDPGRHMPGTGTDSPDPGRHVPGFGARRPRPAPGHVADQPVPGHVADQPVPGHVADQPVPGLLGLLVELHRLGRLHTFLALLPPVVLAAWSARLLAPAAAGAEPSTARLAGRLRRLHRDGLLPGLAATASSFTRQAWRAALDGAGDGAVRAVLDESDDGATGESGVAWSRAALDPPLDPSAGLAPASPDSIRPDESILRHRAGIAAVVAAALRLGVAETEVLLAAGAAPDAVDRPGVRRLPPAATPRQRQRPGVVTVEVDSVLPFLLLGPLSRDGFLRAVPSLLNRPGIFAAVLAATVLPPTDPVVPLFSGLPRTPAPDAVATFADRAGEALPALDAILTASLAAGHDPESALVLSADADGLVVTDLDGLFPMAWPDSATGLLPLWRSCGSPPVVITPAAATPALLRDLNRAGVRFAVNVPPSRGERWRRLPGPDNWWSNRDAPAPCDAQMLAWAAGTLEELGAALTPAGIHDLRLRRSAVLASAYALGSIAWSLWRHRETTHPLLARDRFADLSGRIRIDPGSVTVTPPLGRRRTDLHDHGWLDDIPAVPWLAGRTVRFTEG